MSLLDKELCAGRNNGVYHVVIAAATDGAYIIVVWRRTQIVSRANGSTRADGFYLSSLPTWQHLSDSHNLCLVYLVSPTDGPRINLACAVWCQKTNWQ